MTEESLNEGEILLSTIKTTEKGLKNLLELLIEKEDDPRQKDNKHHDGLYNLVVVENKDGSGKCCDLARYGGNIRLLKVIIDELSAQLKEYKEAFESLR